MSVLYVLSIVGFFLLGFGIYVRLGGAKVWYLIPGIPVLMPQIVQNMLIPLGTTLFVLAIGAYFAPDIEARQKLLNYIFLPMLLITIILGIWSPRWMRPRWLVYLQDTYGLLTQKMLKVAAENAREWTQRVQTQQGLEEWARETCLALGYDIPESEQDEEESILRFLREVQEREEKEQDE